MTNDNCRKFKQNIYKRKGSVSYTHLDVYKRQVQVDATVRLEQTSIPVCD